ncbi:MAG: nucleoside triphosphate pyrophosphohydrolase [Bacteroidales bacterium]|nr:nucleoside triphosphate pyrophosphohydrolase [Bacteroidales bacterium]
MKDETLLSFRRLLDIMDKLRKNCPWDKKQTFESLRHLSIEEVYELSDAILKKNDDEIKKELGDLLLHLVFYSKIASEKKSFDIKDVIDGICEKLIVRHPHIFGNVKVENAQQVKDNWEKIKMKEGKKSVLEGVPTSLPALIKAYRMQEKARGVGFDWENKEQVWKKVREEINELKKEISKKNNHKKIEDEFGDVLFALINYARFIDVEPETALEKTNKKFLKRFQYLEKSVIKDGKKLSEMTLKEMDVYWDKAKKV